MGDCHSFDPGSKFGLKKKPNERPGPGAYDFSTISNSGFKNLQQNQANRDSPHPTGLHNTLQPQQKSAPMHEDKDNTVVSPLVENGSLPVENCIMNGGDNDNNLLLLPAKTTKGSEIDENGFRQYLLAQRKRNLKQIILKAAKHGHILKTGDASEILTFSNTKRRRIMEALVCLSKYQCKYNTWKEIKEKYQLKWTSPDSLEVFQSIFNNDEKNYSAMLSWLKGRHILPLCNHDDDSTKPKGSVIERSSSASKYV
jgi:hypothetical protein